MAGTVTALVVVAVAMWALGAGWARCRRAWTDYRGSVAVMRAAWRAAWRQTLTLVQVAVVATVMLLFVVGMLTAR